jgi:hypothetical protein
MMEQKRPLRTNENCRDTRSRKTSRRQFIKLASAASLLAGCRVSRQGATLTSTPTSIPTNPPTPSRIVTIRQPEIIRTYPDVSSKVVLARHTGARGDGVLVPEVL